MFEMDSVGAIHQSENLLIIRLKSARLEDIVEKKLLYLLKADSFPSRLMARLYRPVEQALIEAVLAWKKSNQIQTARALGINRNTLRKKIKNYKISLTGSPSRFPVGRELFPTQASRLDLLEVSRFKFHFISMEQESGNNLIHVFCSPVEKAILFATLRHFRDNQVRTAHSLGINRNTLKKKLSLHGIPLKSRRIPTGA